MQKLAILVGQFAIVAAVKYMANKVYSAEGCPEESLKQEGMFPEESLLKGGEWGVCTKLSAETSIKASCPSGGNLEVSYFAGETCAGSATMTVKRKCAKDDKQQKWETLICDADATGYSAYEFSLYYSSTDCSGNVSETRPLGTTKDGSCVADASIDDNGTWTAKSTKTTRSGNILTMEEFSTMDCAGSPSSTKPFTCGNCTPVGQSSWILNCPVGADVASGATQPSKILPVLLLLAVTAKQG